MEIFILCNYFDELIVFYLLTLHAWWKGKSLWNTGRYFSKNIFCFTWKCKSILIGFFDYLLLWGWVIFSLIKRFLPSMTSTTRILLLFLFDLQFNKEENVFIIYQMHWLLKWTFLVYYVKKNKKKTFCLCSTTNTFLFYFGVR